MNDNWLLIVNGQKLLILECLPFEHNSNSRIPLFSNDKMKI